MSKQQGFVLWFTGLSGAGKTTISNIVEPELERRGFMVDHLDGDIVRTHLSKGLGFSKEDRDTNIARIGWVASRIARAGAVVVVSAISPYEEMRRHARSLVEQHAPFVEIYVATSRKMWTASDSSSSRWVRVGIVGDVLTTRTPPPRGGGSAPLAAPERWRPTRAA